MWLTMKPMKTKTATSSLWTLLDRLPRPARGEAEDIAAGPYIDSRPRIDYRLPDGRVVAIIHDHDEVTKPKITFGLADGRVVLASLVDHATCPGCAECDQAPRISDDCAGDEWCRCDDCADGRLSARGGR